MNEVKSLVFTINFSITFDLEDSFPHPHRLTDFDKSLHEDILSKARVLGFPGHFLAPVNTTLVLAFSIGIDNFKNNPIIRRFKFYLESIEGEIASLDSKGKLNVNPNDTMSGIRWLVTINSDLLYHDMIIEKKIPINGLIVELYEFIFQDPFKNTSKLKSAVNLLMKASWGMCTGGLMAFWNGILDDGTGDAILGDYYAQEIIHGNNAYTDELYINYIYPHLNDELSKLHEYGLHETARTLNGLISAKFTKEQINVYMAIEHMIGTAGFTRTDNVLSHQNQLIISLILNMK
jgi:hypothetical protein